MTTLWEHKVGKSLGGFVIGHLAKRNGNSNTAFIVGLRRDGLRTKVLLDYLRERPLDIGGTSRRLEVDGSAISSTWRPGATVHPERKPGVPEVHEFGSAPYVVPKGYSLLKEVRGTVSEVQQKFKGQYVVLVKSAELQGEPGNFLFGVFAWTPEYERWRHGGWYVSGVQYDSGGCGCVSSNYVDHRWRIACDDRRYGLNEPGDFTYPSRDAAARAELEYVQALREVFA